MIKTNNTGGSKMYMILWTMKFNEKSHLTCVINDDDSIRLFKTKDEANRIAFNYQLESNDFLQVIEIK